MENVSTAFVGERLLRVARFTRDGIYFSELIGAVGEDVTFLFCANSNGIAAELPVSGKVKIAPGGCVVPVQFDSVQSSVLRMLFNVHERANQHDILRIMRYPIINKSNLVKSTRLSHVALTAALCLVLIASIAYVREAKQDKVFARVAFIATDATVLESGTSGIIEYLAETRDIKLGEVFAAVRTKSGRSVFFESNAAGTLQNAGAHAGRSITKGSPLVYVSKPTDRLFVKAYVDTATATKLPNGFGAYIEIVNSKGSYVMSAGKIAATDITRGFQYTDKTGNPLSEVILRLPDSSDFAPGQTVTVRFVNSTSSYLALASRQIGSMLQGWMKRSGVQS